jgi:hypothetical protein
LSKKRYLHLCATKKLPATLARTDNEDLNLMQINVKITFLHELKIKSYNTFYKEILIGIK